MPCNIYFYVQCNIHSCLQHNIKSYLQCNIYFCLPCNVSFLFTDLPGLSQELHHSCLLDELVFWMVKYEFPEKLVTLLLSLLPDEHYKARFILRQQYDFEKLLTDFYMHLHCIVNLWCKSGLDDTIYNEGFIYFFCVMDYIDMQWFEMIQLHKTERK